VTAAVERVKSVFVKPKPASPVAPMLEQATQPEGPSSEPAPAAPREGSASNRTRRIPVHVRDAVLLRDRERCTYVGPDGHHCAATTNLHLDHIEPFARGGAHEASNLRVLCAAHNRRRADVELGTRGFVSRRGSTTGRPARSPDALDPGASTRSRSGPAQGLT
jgi:hypothetical protein